MICTEARSGSNFLCQLLESTGVLGRPLEYFNGEGRRKFDFPDYPDDPQAQLAAILEYGAGPNGVFGFKLFSRQADRVSATRWAERLPGLRFIHLERLDYLGQAISAEIGLQTGVHRSYAPKTSEVTPRFDREKIAERMRSAARGQARWRLFFARNGISPLYLTYEGLSADPAAAVRAVVDLMGIEGPVVIDPAKVRVAIQRDDVNEAWRQRFLKEAGDLTAPESLGAHSGRALVRDGATLIKQRLGLWAKA